MRARASHETPQPSCGRSSAPPLFVCFRSDRHRSSWCSHAELGVACRVVVRCSRHGWGRLSSARTKIVHFGVRSATAILHPLKQRSSSQGLGSGMAEQMSALARIAATSSEALSVLYCSRLMPFVEMGWAGGSLEYGPFVASFGLEFDYRRGWKQLF